MADREMTDSLDTTEAAEEHRRLSDKHQKCEDRLEELRGRLILSEEEKVEEVNLKKHKLYLKDRMASLSRVIRGGVAKA